jgi:ADP-ribosylglycohydrolase
MEPWRNGELLRSLRAEGWVLLEDAPLLEGAPPALPAGFDFARVEGMLLGLAIGDALGNTSEGMLPQHRRELHGEIRDYLPNRYADWRPVGLPSDDSQLAFWTLEQLLEDGRLVPERLAARFASGRIFGIGQSVSEFVRNARAGRPWYACGAASAGNGALMRIAPVLVPHLGTASSELWADAALGASVTHRDQGSTATCVAFVRLLWEALRSSSPPEPQWWLAAFLEAARPLEGEETRYRPRGGAYAGYEGPVWRFAELAVTEAFRAGLSAREACDRCYSGAFLLETVPCVLFILTRHADDPEEAIVRAVNDTRDNDTVGAIVGAAVGALHGAEALPERWRAGLLGRTRENDDGQVFRLIERARATFWQSARGNRSRRAGR